MEPNWQLSKGRCRRKTHEPYEDLTKSTYEPKLKPYYLVTFLYLWLHIGNLLQGYDDFY